MMRGMSSLPAQPSSHRRLCYDCRYALSNDIPPPHVVHPVSGTYGCYDGDGMAVCPKCGAAWHKASSRVVELFKFGATVPAGHAQGSAASV
jgi:hypothetical protein